MQTYCIEQKENRIYSYLLEEHGRAVEIHCDPVDTRVRLGDIFIGRVQNVVRNLNAAFVEIQPGIMGYLSLEDLGDPLYTKKGKSAHLQQGDELVVQISREAIKTKAPSVTANLTLQGNYAVLEMNRKEIGISRKLPEEQREQLKAAVRELLGDLSMGVIIRTNAGTVSADVVAEEVEFLRKQLLYLRSVAPYRPCRTRLYAAPSLWLKRLTSLHLEEVGRITAESPCYDTISEYLGTLTYGKQIREKLQRYESSLCPMRACYSLEQKLREALSERVWMNSGAYLVIQPTEALTVIDVNSGKCETGKEKEKAFLKINLEAAAESARQLRLRNISGIIIIDFINMESEQNQKAVMSELSALLRLDPVQAHVIDMTKLNLVEITRKKVERSLRESVLLQQTGGNDDAAI